MRCVLGAKFGSEPEKSFFKNRLQFHVPITALSYTQFPCPRLNNTHKCMFLPTLRMNKNKLKSLCAMHCQRHMPPYVLLTDATSRRYVRLHTKPIDECKIDVYK